MKKKTGTPKKHLFLLLLKYWIRIAIGFSWWWKALASPTYYAQTLWIAAPLRLMDGGGDSSSVRFAQGNEKENLVVFFSFYKSPAWFGFHLGRRSQRDISLTYRKCFSLKQHSGANQLTYCLELFFEKKKYISYRVRRRDNITESFGLDKMSLGRYI
jgi:hypothetical protein